MLHFWDLCNGNTFRRCLLYTLTRKELNSSTGYPKKISKARLGVELSDKTLTSGSGWAQTCICLPGSLLAHLCTLPMMFLHFIR